MKRYAFLLLSILFSHCYATSTSDEHSYPMLQEYCAATMSWTSPYTELESFLAQAQTTNHDLLPPHVQSILSAFKERKSESCHLLFSGLPLDQNLIPTPDLQLPTHKQSFVSEFCLSLFGTFLGQPFNYIQEENGNIFRNIRPTRMNQSQQASDGSKVELELHTETAFHPLKPDFLMLYCLRTDRDGQAYTLVSDLTDILAELDEDTIYELEKKQYLTGIDVSFGNVNRDKFYPELLPVLSGAKDNRRITYDLDMMNARTEQGQLALEKLTQAIRKVQQKILLQPGDLLIVDNKRAIHGRTAFQMYGDGYDRWLQRVYISVDPEFLTSIPTQGRIVTTQF